MRPFLPPLLVWLALVTITFAEAVKDREGAVRSDRETMEKKRPLDLQRPRARFRRGQKEWQARAGRVALRAVPRLPRY